MRKALINTATGKVVNVIEVDTDTTFSVSDHTILDAANAQIGGTWNGVAFTPAPAVLDALAPKRTRLSELRAKGWAAMTPQERAEAQQLVFEVVSNG